MMGLGYSCIATVFERVEEFSQFAGTAVYCVGARFHMIPL